VQLLVWRVAIHHVDDSTAATFKALGNLSLVSAEWRNYTSSTSEGKMHGATPIAYLLRSSDRFVRKKGQSCHTVHNCTALGLLICIAASFLQFNMALRGRHLELLLFLNCRISVSFPFGL